MNVRQQIESAVAHHRAGRLADAERIYREILAQDPNQPDALHLLGAIAGQQGRLDEAIGFISRAIAQNPENAIYHSNLSETCRRAGKTEQAISAARQALHLDPKFAAAYYSMAMALLNVRKYDNAVAAFRRAVELNPGFTEALFHLGGTLFSLGQFEDAIAVYRRWLSREPRSFEALCGLGMSLRDSGRPSEAVDVMREAVAIRPDSAQAHNTLGVSLAKTDKTQEAVDVFRRATELQPNNATSFKNLGVGLAELGKYDESIAALQHAIELKPDMPEAHGNLGLLSLMKGDFKRGWAEYEWRWRAQLTFLSPPRDFTQPRWNGERLGGKKILVYAEQGFGDSIQFVRYLPMVERAGGSVVLECQAELVRLLGKAAGVNQIVPAGDPLPGFHCQCPLLSLPIIFSTDLNTIPVKIPYLSPNPAIVERWKKRIDSLPAAFKVGLVWAGSTKNQHDRKRSITFDQVARLADIPRVHFFSLQKDRRNQSPPPPGMTFIDWTDELRDFEETAGLIANLDLVIAVDTAAAHLAGAIGKPVWVMVSFVPDWRWMLDRADSPWYPTMRIFRQKSARDWDRVIQDVSDALRHNANMIRT